MNEQTYTRSLVWLPRPRLQFSFGFSGGGFGPNEPTTIYDPHQPPN